MEKQPSQNNRVEKVKTLIQEKLGRQLDSDELKSLLRLFIRYLVHTQRTEKFGLTPGKTIVNGWAFFLQDVDVFTEFLDHVAFEDSEGHYGGPKGDILEQYDKQHSKDDNTKK